MTITDDAASRTRLLDEAAIRDATARFADAAISADYDGGRTLWADDAEWVIGGTEGQPGRSDRHPRRTRSGRVVAGMKDQRAGQRTFHLCSDIGAFGVPPHG